MNALDPSRARPQAPIDWLLGPLRWFTGLGAAGGAVLLLAAIAAMLWANSSAADSYFRLWHQTRAGLHIGGFSVAGSLEWWINDLLMAVFFLLVGMEIKRELLVGELASFGRAATPVLAAMGGMVVPAGIYLLFNAGTARSQGWGVPMATDIAFALGVLAVMGRRAPASMRIFLASLAIIDDLGALLVIALFYTSQLDYEAMTWAAIVLAGLALGNRLGVRTIWFYALGGIILWHFMHESGIHATIAGVLLASTIPLRPTLSADRFAVQLRQEAAILEGPGEGRAAIERIERDAHAAGSPLIWLEHRLSCPVNFFILPVFALANAGVAITGAHQGAGGGIHWDGSSWGIALGLLVGKPVGIFMATWLSVRLGIGSLAPDLSWPRMFAIGLLGGIGFTMALFIAHLAFRDPSDLATAKVAVLGGSVVAGLAGVAVMMMLPRARAAQAGG